MSKQERRPYAQRKSQSNSEWKTKELYKLAEGFQNYGFHDVKKLSEVIGTKSESEVRSYIEERALRTKRRMQGAMAKRVAKPPSKENGKTTRRPRNTTTLQQGPPVRKWHKMALSQMVPSLRRHEYSTPLIRHLCEAFYEQQKEPESPEVVNCKAIAKYFLEIQSGLVPADLPILESKIVLRMKENAMKLIESLDSTEEKDFVEKFQKATTFVPMQVKDEFKKGSQKSSTPDIPGCVSVPEEIFMNLSKHRKLVQSFNPLSMPLWCLQKQQELVSKELEKL